MDPTLLFTQFAAHDYICQKTDIEQGRRKKRKETPNSKETPNRNETKKQNRTGHAVTDNAIRQQVHAKNTISSTPSISVLPFDSRSKRGLGAKPFM